MKKRSFKPLVFFTGLIIGLAAAAVFFEAGKPFPEIGIAPVVEVEEFEVPLPESPAGLDYDTARYDEINSVLKFILENRENPKSDLLMPFDRAANLLSLENVAWDEVGGNNPPYGQVRMYHFRGFCLFLYLEKRIPGNPDDFTAEDKVKKGVEYICDLPSLQIDGLEDPRERVRFVTTTRE